MTQDDAHIFVTPEQIEEEIFGALDFAAYLYDLFGMEARFELSTRPDNKLGTDEEWDFTEGALRSALDRRGIDYTVNEGDGAFYGPKIDLHMTDVLGRSWQMGTIQLDSQMPARFGLTYIGEDNAEHTPYVVHRALFGSLERFMGILIEHYGGAFPVWLAPVQVRIVPVGEDHREAARALAEKLGEFRVEVDDSDETVGKRIRNAEVEKIPYVRRLGRQGVGGRDRRPRRTAESSPRSRLDELLGGAARGCYGVDLQSRGDTFLTSGAQGLSEVQPRRLEGSRPLLCSGLVVSKKEEADSLVKRL